MAELYEVWHGDFPEDSLGLLLKDVSKGQIEFLLEYLKNDDVLEDEGKPFKYMIQTVQNDDFLLRVDNGSYFEYFRLVPVVVLGGFK